MKYTVQTTHISLSESDSEYLDEKLTHLDKFVPRPYSCSVHIEGSPRHKSGDIFTCAITLYIGKKLIRSDQAGSTSREAIDRTVDIVKRELSRLHDQNKKRGPG